MGELAIRRNRGFAVARPQDTVKTEKSGRAAPGQGAAQTTGLSVSDTLRQLLTRVSQAESRTRESRRTLQTGEAVLDEVQDRLSRAAELIQKAAGDEAPDHAALQAELERLREEIDRMLTEASAGDARLFLDGDMDAGAEALLRAAISELPLQQEGALPDWLARALTQNALSPEELLAALGLDKSAGVAELLAAIANSSLDSDPAAGYLAALYLGAVISGGAASGTADQAQALDGLRQLLEKLADGMPPDQAVELLTNGVFSSLSDLQSQFTGGTAPWLQDFLTGLLLSGGEASAMTASPLLTLLTESGGVELDLLMGLLTALESGTASAGTVSTDSPAGSAEAAGGAGAASSPVSVLEFEGTRVMGRDLSGVFLNEETGELTIGGTADVVLQGAGKQEARAVLLTGSGTVTLQNVQLTTLTAASAETRILSAGETRMALLQLEPGVSLTLGGEGALRTGDFQAGPSNTLRLTGGAVVLEEENGGGDPTRVLPLPVLLDGPASLAAQASSVSNSNGKPLDAFDVIWRTMLPGWSAVTSLTVDGRQAKLALDSSCPLRLWLEKGEHGYPAHVVAFRGRDKAGRPRLRYAYLRWNRSMEAFEEIEMYPNPFTVTGGEAGRDWSYEEDTHTLRILTGQVSAISGGAGLDANQEPFSGRIALDSQIGAVELTLGGVACRVASGRAFSLGRENDVTLLLRSGTDNYFESGEGCAGISLEDGASLQIDRAEPQGSGKPAGTLTAAGGSGGAGIGRDSGGSPAGSGGRDRTSRILIRGGDITAAGSGGGAGIGGGLGSPMGDISIHGGKVHAQAAFHAAAIGAGVQGPCGDILITGTARIVKAQGGDPGADIGACLFGSCGKVVISGAADIGGAKLRTRAGISLQMGEDTVTLPQFQLSSRVLGLDQLDLSTREAIQAAKKIVEADRRWVSQLQDAYSAMYGWLEQSSSGLNNVRRYINVTGGLVRDDASAGILLEDTRRSIPLPSSQAMRTHGRRGTEDVRHLFR